MDKGEIKEKLDTIKSKTDNEEIKEICDELKEEVKPKIAKTRGDPICELN